ncbi:MAG: M24 family metallopeptidase [Desulfohalobiaceae bacterium]|nr:M24 family metallopeptidase [Desulfohalobiaceae bacterium]
MIYFEPVEFHQRLDRVKESMYRNGIEVLLISDPSNMNYLTGYDGYSYYVHQGVLVFLDEDQPLWFGRAQDSNGARLTTWLDDDRIRAYADDYVQSDFKHPMSFVAGLIREKGAERRRLGVEMDNYYFSGRCLEQLRTDLPQIGIRDANLLVNWVRMVKSEKELEYTRMAARITERMLETAIEAIQPGVREADAAGRVYQAQLGGMEDYTGDYSAIVPLMPSGERTSTAHLTWTDRTYEPDEICYLELSGCVHRYHAPMARSLKLGKPSTTLQDIAKYTVAGLNSVLEFAGPGVTCEAVEAEWRRAIAGSPVVKKSRIGYPFGLSYPPDWGERTISLRPGDKNILQPNMTVHVMCGIWVDEYGFACSEPIRITENGCENLIDFPRKLFTKP